MKTRSEIICFILLNFFSLKSYSQCSNTQPACTLNTPLGAGDYKARDEVHAISGSEAHPSGYQQIHLFIDKTIQLNTTYQSSVNYSDDQINSPIDHSLAVGTISGQSGVTSTGQATYDIPIMAPPGTNGMAPTLAISYNSEMPDGILGRGWNIRGLSVITRVSKDIYHDVITPNTKKGIALNGTDVYALDGTRIILPHLENDNFSYITLTSDGYFTVETKQGLKMKYGSTTDSKLILGTVTLAWYLSEIRDQYDNYISYIYYNQNKEVAIKEIQYSGAQPYNSVKFYYDIRSDKTTHWLAGNALPSTLLLREIEINSEGNFIKNYQFKYGFNSQTFLNEVSETGSDYLKLNSTFFKYGDNITSPNEVSVTIPKNVSNADLMIYAEYRVGDFNGDGKSDLLAFEYDQIFLNGSRHYTGNRKLYLNNNDGSTFTEINLSILSNFYPYPLNDFSSSFYPGSVQSSYYGPRSSYVNVSPDPNTHNSNFYAGPSPGQIGMQVADFDGDGKDDIVIASTSSGHTIFTVYYSTGSDFSPNVANRFVLLDAADPAFLADVDGDGVPEAIEYDPIGKRFLIWWFQTGSEIVISHFRDVSGNIIFPIYSGFGTVDLNGDGIQELVATRNGSTYILKFQFPLPLCQSCSNNICSEIYSETTPTVYYENYYGDFNGDGIIDNIKATDPEIGTGASLRFGTGTSFTPFTPVNSALSFDNSIKHIICDINNDGKSDLVQLNTHSNIRFDVSYGGQEGMPMTFLGSTGTMTFPRIVDYNYIPFSNQTNYNPNYPNHNTNINDEPEFLVGDFDGDGRPDIFFKTNNNGQRVIAYINKGSTQHLLTTISDGFRNKTNFKYATLANGGSNVYVKGSGSTYPVVDTQMPLYVVSESSSPDGVGGNNASTYKYEGASTHMQGKGFMGFNKFTTINPTANILVENNFDLSNSNISNNTFFEKVPWKTKTFLLSDLNNPITEETYSSTFVATSGKAHFIKTDDIVSHDISGKTITKNFTYDDANGNLTHSSVDVNGIETAEVTTTYEHAGTWGSLLNVPYSINTTVTRNGDGPYARQIDYRHDYSTGGLNTTIHDIGTSNEITESYTYYPAGVCSTKTVTAANCLTCPSKDVSYRYDSKFRFITETHNPLDQITEITIDPKFGVPLSVKGIDGLITSYNYDGLGRNIRTLTPDNLLATTKYEWVESSPSAPDPLIVSSLALYSVSTSRPGTPSTKTYFDALGREILSEFDGFASVKTYKEKKYDIKGNLYKETGSYQDIGAHLTTTYHYQDVTVPNELFKTETTDDLFPNTTLFSYTRGGGNTTITITAPDLHISSKTTDATGKLTSATDNGGTLTYDYFSNGLTKEIKLNDGVNNVTTNTMAYDPFGHQTLLFDKDARNTTYTYDAYNQLISQTDERGNTYNGFEYDKLGRLKHNLDPDGGLYSYSYIPSGNGVNKISEISNSFTGISYAYTYDGLNRTTSYTENIPGQSPLTTSYSYDDYSNILNTTYPGGFATTNEYDDVNHCYLKKINSGSTTIWKGDEMNALGQYNKYTLGNGVQTQIDYNNFGLPKEILAPGIQDLILDFNLSNGNLNWRKDLSQGRNLKEEFHYDNLNRLDISQVTSPTYLTANTILYNRVGTINNKSDAGTYSAYWGNHPDAVYKLTVPTENISKNEQVITYTPFNKIATLHEPISSDDYLLTFTYGPEQQRKKTVLTYQGNLVSTKIFYPGYEKETAGSNTREVYYINAPTGLCAMYVVENGVGKMHYVYTDHLGSILKVTDASGTVVAEQNFDAWGRNRNPNDWTYDNIPAVPDWLYRGFTGHEHLSQFALINMNGRVYDPITGTMLSPDNNVQAPDFTQNYNRYVYAFNNPLKYTDPSGEDIFDFIKKGINVLTFYGRVYSEATAYINDKINGQTREGGYFHWDYLSGNASPYTVPNNIVPGGVDHSDFYGGGDRDYIGANASPNGPTVSYSYEPVAAWYQKSRVAGGEWTSPEFRGYDYGWVETTIAAQGGGGIDNTTQAFDHYFFGKGVPVGLGPNTVNALLNNSGFTTRHNRIISGQTSLMKGNFSVDMTKNVFHVGKTNVNYSINCASGNCNVIYDLFVNDGFWDVDFLDEKVIGGWLGIKKYQPDGLGPNLERFGGQPYPYIPSTVIYSFPNPGYK